MKLKERFKDLATLMGEFIKLAPSFEGDLELARSLGKMIGEIEIDLNREEKK